MACHIQEMWRNLTSDKVLKIKVNYIFEKIVFDNIESICQRIESVRKLCKVKIYFCIF